jgi:thymidylate synthase (FAD)
MSARLISYSRPPDDSFGSVAHTSLQDLVAYCARVSNPANQHNTTTNERLINYLIRNQHWSPLEMVNICIEIETTRDIARQILRHRSFSFQEFSQRYAIADLGFVTKEARLQDTKNRQNSMECNDVVLEDQWDEIQNVLIEHVENAYKWAIDNGIAKEQARVVLPEGMTLTRMYMNGTLRSWVHYIQLRSANGTQKEHRDVAIACANVIEPIFPMITSLLTDADLKNKKID